MQGDSLLKQSEMVVTYCMVLKSCVYLFQYLSEKKEDDLINECARYWNKHQNLPISVNREMMFFIIFWSFS